MEGIRERVTGRSGARAISNDCPRPEDDSLPITSESLVQPIVPCIIVCIFPRQRAQKRRGKKRESREGVARRNNRATSVAALFVKMDETVGIFATGQFAHSWPMLLVHTRGMYARTKNLSRSCFASLKKEKKKKKGRKKNLGSVTAHLYVSVSLFDEKERKKKKNALFISALLLPRFRVRYSIKRGTESSVFESGEEGIKEGA